MTPRLVPHAGLLEAPVFSVAEGATTLGRSAECGICIQHQSLSRRHAQLERREGRVVIVDLQSKNGVLVNGAQVDRRELHDGDLVQMGDVVLRFEDPEAPPRPSNAAVSTRPPVSEAAPSAQPELVMDIAPVPLEQLLSSTVLGALRSSDAPPDPRLQQKLQLLLKSAQVLSSPEHIDTLLEKIVDLVFQVLDIDRAALLLVDDRTGQLVARVVRAPRHPDRKGPIYSQHIVEHVRANSVGALFADAGRDPRLLGSESVQLQSIRASMCVPLKPKDQVIGVLYVDNLTMAFPFAVEELELLTAFAGQAAIAIENAALYRRIEAESVARAQMVLQEKLASLSAMVAAIAHELKNPINLLANFAGVSSGLTEELSELLSGGAPLGPEAVADAADVVKILRDNLGKIEGHARRAGEVIAQMQHHARTGASPREEVKLDTLVAQSVVNALRAARPRGVDFDVEVKVDNDPALGPVECVRAELARVLVSVLDNALLAVRDKRRALGEPYAPRVAVTTAAQGGRVEIRVRDNGVGIPPDVAPRVFDPFFTTRPSGQGAGLGLSISYDVVVQGHQGTMRITSEPGDHTEVIISIPMIAR